MTLSESHQVARVPKPEFLALIVLRLLLPVVGVLMAANALVLSRRRGVVDIQARMGIGAMVASVFEHGKLGETATNVRELYAEFRGLPTRRILAVDPRVSGGKAFITVDGAYEGEK